MTSKRLFKLAPWLAFAGAVGLAVMGPVSGTPLSLPSFSPLVALCAALGALAAAGWTVVAGLVLLSMVIWRHRWFCRWVCPVGFMLDGCRKVCPRPRFVPRLPLRPLGIWLFLATLGGAVLGYPLFLWLDPLALMAGTANVWRTGWTVAGLAGAAGLPLLLLLEWLQPHLWCVRICPLGGMQDFLSALRRRLRSSASGVRTPARGLAKHLGRRTLLGAGAGLAAVWGGRALGWAKGPQVVRPPGAAPEENFAGLCVRCGSCMAVCPARILHPDLGKGGVSGFLAPVAEFSTDYCREDCLRCGEVCPSGALARLSKERKRTWVMGVARIELDLCLLALGGECNACIVRCPYGALSVGSSEDGFGSEPILEAGLCTGCGACEAFCPAEPRKAVTVIRDSGLKPRTSAPLAATHRRESI